MFNYLRFPIIAFILVIAVQAKAQNLKSSDDLLQEGQVAISKEKDYPKAITLLRTAYLQSPEYPDVIILLGRAYQLNKNADSARYFFNKARVKDPKNPDVLNYLVGLEYSSGNIDAAVSTLDSALYYHPGSQDLLLKKASMLFEQKKYPQSQQALNSLLKVNPKNEIGIRLNNQLSLVTASNKVSLYYDYSYFDELFNPWHSVSLGYQHTTHVGSIIGRVNYANRSNGLSGYQYELETYPLFTKKLYGNFSLAIGSGDPVFPDLTARGSLFRSFGTYEIEGGLRYVKTTDENFFIYNAGLSKYVSKFLLGFKTYLSDFAGASGQGFQFTSRYYYGEDANNVFILGLGTGVAPDLANRNLGIANIANLSGQRIFSEYRRVVGVKNILSILASAGHDEYTPTKAANQYSIGFGYQRKF
ncbi:MAG: YaiO family outer membrane beta-barrel protein [Flavobacterium sp.]|nr:YaiO family outer membrane beta-barrel protein [Pedobacter sp.]